MTNISIIKSNNETITISNASQLSIGSKLIYIEYAEGVATRIRAFGKNEFARVEIKTPDKHDVSINLEDVNKVDMRFMPDYVLPAGFSGKEFDVTSEPEQGEDDDLLETNNLF